MGRTDVNNRTEMKIQRAYNHLARQLKHQQSESVSKGLDVVHVIGEEVNGNVLCLVEKHQEGVSASRHVCFRVDELLHKLRTIGKKLLSKVFVNTVSSQRGIATHI